MRIQDELRTLYPTQGWQPQKFIISELERLGLSFDSEELLGFLESQLKHRVPFVRDQALFGLTLFLPSFYRRKYEVDQTRGGVWTDYALDRRGYARWKQERQAREAATETLRRQALVSLEPILRALTGVLRRESGFELVAIALALSQFRSGRVQEALLAALDRSGLDFGLLLAAARSGAFRDSDETLLTRCLQAAARHPDPLLALACLSGASLEKLVRDHGRRFGPVARWNLAIALDHAGPSGDLEAVIPLLRGEDPWTRVYGLRILERSEDPRTVDILERVYSGESSEFVRARAIRAAGGYRTDGATSLCGRATRDPASSVQAQAIESLVRQRVPREDLVPMVADLAKSPELRVQANAMLALVDPSTSGLPDDLLTLVTAASPFHRLEGTYVLGFHQQERARDILGFLALRDPVGAVRNQAVKSLSRFPVSMAGSVLVDLLLEGAEDTARVTVRALTRYSGKDAATVAEYLQDRLTPAATPSSRAAGLIALGSLVARAGEQIVTLDTFLARLEDPEGHVRAAAMVGLKNQAHLVEEDVGPLLRARAKAEREPRMATLVLTTACLLGDQESIEALAVRVASREPETRSRAVEAALEIGVLASEVLPFEGFPAWRRALEACVPAAPAALGEDRVVPGWRLAEANDEAPAFAGDWQNQDPAPAPAGAGSPATTGVDPGGASTAAPPPAAGAGPALAPPSDLPPRPASPPPRSPERASALSREDPELSRRLEAAWKRPPGRQSVGERLRKDTYLVEPGTGSTLTLVREWMQFHPVVQFAASPRGLVLVPILVVSVILLTTFRSRPVPGGRELLPPPPVAFTVGGLAGPVALGSDDEAPWVGSPMGPGDRLATGEGARAILLSGHGGRVDLDASSRIQVRGIDDKDRVLTVTLEQGTAEFDFRRGEKVVLQQGAGRIVVGEALVRLRVVEGGVELLARDPGVTWIRGGASMPVEPGTTRFLETL